MPMPNKRVLMRDMEMSSAKTSGILADWNHQPPCRIALSRMASLMGLENITNKLYSYHLSKNSIDLSVANNPISDRIYEIGRNAWIRVKYDF